MSWCPVLQLNAVQTLLGLLSHDNSDIALAVVDLLQELTDVETVSEAGDEVEGLVDALLKEQVTYYALFFPVWWNLRIMDTLGTSILSIVQRFSLLRR